MYAVAVSSSEPPSSSSTYTVTVYTPAGSDEPLAEQVLPDEANGVPKLTGWSQLILQVQVSAPGSSNVHVIEKFDPTATGETGSTSGVMIVGPTLFTVMVN